MHCDRARAKIQDWFDRPGAPSMPPEIGEHIRACGECRALITRWNAIELRLQAMREEAPDLSPDFRRKLQARLRAVCTPPPRPWFVRHWHFTLAGAAVFVVALFFTLRLLGGAHLPTRPDPSAVAVVRPAASGSSHGE